MSMIKHALLATFLYTTSVASGQVIPPSPMSEPAIRHERATSDHLIPMQFQPGSLELQMDQSLTEGMNQKPASIYDLPCPPHGETNFFGFTEYAFTRFPAVDVGLAVIRSMEQATNETPDERKPPFGICEPQTIPLVINLGVNLAGEAVSYVAGTGASYAVKRGVSKFANKSYHTVRRFIQKSNTRHGGVNVNKDFSVEFSYHGNGVEFNATQEATDAAIESLFGTPEQSPPFNQMAEQLHMPLQTKLEPCPDGDAGCQALIERINQQLREQEALPEAYRNESDQFNDRLKGYDRQCHTYQLLLGQFEAQRSKTDESARTYLSNRVDVKLPKRPNNRRMDSWDGPTRLDRPSGGRSSTQSNPIADSGDYREFERGWSRDTPDGGKQSITERVKIEKDNVTHEVEFKETRSRDNLLKDTKIDTSKINR